MMTGLGHCDWPASLLPWLLELAERLGSAGGLAHRRELEMASIREPRSAPTPLDEQSAAKSPEEVAEGTELVSRLRATLLLERLEELENEIP